MKEPTTQIVSARIDRGMVAQLDAAARSAGTDRNGFIARSIRAALTLTQPQPPTAPPQQKAPQPQT